MKCSFTAAFPFAAKGASVSSNASVALGTEAAMAEPVGFSTITEWCTTIESEGRNNMCVLS